MTDFKVIALIDIGKTNAKTTLFDCATRSEIAERRIANRVIDTAPYPHYNCEALWLFICQSLQEFSQDYGFDAISITSHGASIALLDQDGNLALPVLDYEHLYPQNIQADYAKLRPQFSQTFSPWLTGGLNVGAQLHYQKTMFPDAFAAAKTILTYPQYWAFRLTGYAVNEVTSLGCHTDLWQPLEATYSSLVDALDIRDRMAPIQSAFSSLGNISEGLASRLKIKHSIPVYCGIHDSNASLLPHLIGRKPPFSVVSSGTWLIHFAAGGTFDQLNETRDTLANVDAYGHAVPSSRFMGGREFEILTQMLGKLDFEEAERALPAAIAKTLLLLPNLAPGTGPFPLLNYQWRNTENATAHEKWAAACLYLALMTQTCLKLIGALGEVIVEGPFAKNKLFTKLLASLTKRPVIAMPNSTGTSLGTAMLTGSIEYSSDTLAIHPQEMPLLDDYHNAWHQAVSEAEVMASQAVQRSVAL